MTLEEAKKTIRDTIKFELRHPDYEKNVEIARKSKIYVTGKDQDKEYLLELRDKETKRQKLIRVKVTKPITPFALNPVKTEYEKIFRVDGVVKDISHTDTAKNKLISQKAKTYHANQSVTEYFKKRYLHYQFIDPNAWHITEVKNVFGEGGTLDDKSIYPFEVSSNEAINYKYENGVEQWLIVMQERTERVLKSDDGESKENTLHDYYFFGHGFELKYTEVGELQVVVSGGGEPQEESILIGKNDEPTTFIAQSWETGATEFPGHKFGCYDDPTENNGTVKVPPFWTGARFLLDDLIQTKSTFDTSKYNHVFPKLFHYDYKCKYERLDAKSNMEYRCFGGFLNGNKEMPCPECKGNGGTIHISENDIVTFDLPRDPDALAKLPDLSKLAYYHEPPLGVTQALWEWVQVFNKWVYLASFNAAGNFDKEEVQKTKFESAKIWDAKNTRIYPCAVHLSRMYEKTGRIMAQYLEANDEGFTSRHFFPQGMKLEPLDVLIQRFEKAKSAGLSYEVVWDIHCSILGKSFLDEPGKVEEIKAWEYWKPFKSMQTEDVQMVLTMRAQDDFDRLLWENWDSVKNEVYDSLKGKPFAPLKRAKQFELITGAVEKVGVKIKTKEEEEPSLDNFPPIIEEEEELDPVET